MFGVALLFAVLTLVVGLLGGLLPSSLNFSESDGRMRIATSVAAGLLLASALFVVIPEGFHTASGGHAHGDGDALSGPVALVMLEYEDGAISSGTAMSEIRSIVHGDGHGEHSDHEHGEDATLRIGSNTSSRSTMGGGSTPPRPSMTSGPCWIPWTTTMAKRR